MLENTETNIKIELFDADNNEENYTIWAQQLEDFMEEAKNLVCKAIDVSRLVLNSGLFPLIFFVKFRFSIIFTLKSSKINMLKSDCFNSQKNF